MLEGMSVARGLVDPSQCIPAGDSEAWATARSVLRVEAIIRAAGTPLPVASPTTTPRRPSASSKEVVEVTPYFPSWLVEGSDLPVL